MSKAPHKGKALPKTPMTAAALLCAALFISIAIPRIIHARQEAAAQTCIDNLREIDGAKQQWAMEHHTGSNATPTWEDIRPYLPWHRNGGNLIPKCPAGGTYTIGRMGAPPTCTFPNHTLALAPFTVHVVEQEGNPPIEDVTVEVRDESGRKSKARTDENGWATVWTWPYKPASVVIFKKGYVTSSNTAEAILAMDNFTISLKRK